MTKLRTLGQLRHRSVANVRRIYISAKLVEKIKKWSNLSLYITNLTSFI